MLTSDDFKNIMRRWAATVTVVTTKTDGVIYGLTATAFTSLGIAPPTVLVCMNKNARTHALVTQSGIFCINFLTPAMVEVSNRFAGRMPDTERFAGLKHREAVTGAPVLEDALAFIDCKVIDALSGGDHTIFIGEALAGAVQHADATPLQYLGGKYRRVGDEI